MKLRSLLSAVGIGTERETEITGIVSDSKAVIPGSLFVCIAGETSDGHGFAADASVKGAAAVIFESGRELPGRVICPAFGVPNTRKALSLLLAEWYGRTWERMKIAAVTGTNGKTSTVAFLESIIADSGAICGRIGTLSCFVGGRGIPVSPSGTHSFTTPDQERLYRIMSEMAAAGAGYAVMEASSHALSQYRLDGLCPEVGVFLNLTREHLDFHGSMDNYFAAKAGLFSLSRTGLTNIDCHYGREIKRLFGNAKTFGKSADADFCGKDINVNRDGIEYTLQYSGGEIRIRSQIAGSFTFENTLAAASAALMLGLSPENVSRGIAALAVIPGRMERVKFGTPTDFDAYIDYAHTPDALEKVLSAVREFIPSGGRIILVFGCGGDRDRSKRPVMGRIATALASVTVITSDNPRSESREGIIRDILRGIDREKPYKVITDRKEAICYAVSIAEAGDIILLCGKGHESYEIDENGKHPFNEAEILREAVSSCAK